MPRLILGLQLSLFLLYINTSIAQNYPRKKYNWEENRKITYQLSDSEAKAHAVIILDNRFIDYTDDESYKGIDLYITRHLIVRVNDDKGINEFNKVIIPIEAQDDLIKLKARTISKDGKIREVGKDEVKFINTSKDFANYKIFAMEGAEAGSELEYFYTIKRGKGNGSIWGNNFMYGTEIFQRNTKVKEAKFTITTPSYLLMDTKSYNGFPDVEIDKESDPVVLTARARDIPDIPAEMYSRPMANRMKVAYKINHNTKVTDDHIYTWNSVIKVYYNNLELNYPSFRLPGDLKTNGLDQDQQIQAIENYIKKNIAYKENKDDDLYQPREVLKNKLGNSWGVLRLYASFFKALNIPFNLVVTSNRLETIFDPGFIDFNNFHELLFYFPQSKKYISPRHMAYRYGPAPYEVANNYGVFIESSEKGLLDKIPLMDVNHNKYRINLAVSIDSGMESVEVRKTQVWEGYRAIGLRGSYERLKDEDKRTDFLNNLAVEKSMDGKILEQRSENIELNDTDGNEPLQVVTRFKSSALMEHAGNSYLLNVGWLIEKQTELYQKEKRESDIEMNYPDQLLRTIYVQIPKGYRVKGIEDANIDKALTVNDQRACQFVSSYEASEGGVAINIHEYYIATYYPKERYEEFRQVINAAADFNKVQLVLEKE